VSEKESQEKLERLRKQIWSHLERGNWHSAAMLAEYLSEKDPLSSVTGLVESTRILAAISEALRLNLPVDQNVLVRLDEISSTWPRLYAMPSYQVLLQAVEEAVDRGRTAEMQSVDSGEVPSQRAAPSAWITTRRFLRRVARPKRWAGIAATVSCVVAVLLVLNSVAYYYLREQPRSANGPEAVPGAQATLQPWHGLMDLEGPVDTIILGDSSAGVNLVTGPIADRLGGSAINLGNNALSSLLMDAWMLNYYIDRFGPPRNVIVMRACNSYEKEHNLEFMSVVPLSWGYWDRLGVAPAWKDGEELSLFISKYGVLYSMSDILAYRLTHAQDLLSQPYTKKTADPYYFMGITTASEFANFTRDKQPSFYGPFNPSSDSENAVAAMSEQARSLDFQLYFVMAPEWDEAYAEPDRQAKVGGMVEWLGQFADSQNVHVRLSTPMSFSEDQMQSPNHLRPGPERRFAEAIVDDIVSLQNGMASGEALPLQLSSLVLDKSAYAVEDQVSLSLSLAAEAGSDTTALAEGSVSCLFRWGGKSDGYWVYRAPATAFSVASGSSTEVILTPSVGKLPMAGGYDLVVFIRQDVGGLSYETRIEMPWMVKVS